ncbi:MAG: hypothetical protein ABW067_15615 [Rhizobacter sp.]
MDPDELLHRIREGVAEALEESGAKRTDLVDELAENVNALDDWLSKGGFLPGAWREGGEDHR